MTHLETDLKQLKSNIIEMWTLVIDQLIKSKKVLKKFDKNLACEVLAGEKQVDAFELKINRDCENILALFYPLANDLRFVLASIRINYDLERIGDYAKSIVKTSMHSGKVVDEEILKKSGVLEMFDIAEDMLATALQSFDSEEYTKLRKIFNNDSVLDQINKESTEVLSKLAKKDPSAIRNCLDTHSAIKKLERVGDHTKNIAEEIVFYIDAKVLRHKKKKEKLAELK
jgi:phosphate transport system protein